MCLSDSNVCMEMGSLRHENCKVPECALLGRILFILNMCPCIHCHCYVDDTELYLSINPDDTSQLYKHVLKTKAWMTLYEIHTKLIVLKKSLF